MAQTADVSPPPANTRAIPQVTVDLAAGGFDRALPFDVPFFIAGRAPEGTVSLEVQYAVIPTSGDVSNLVWAPGFRWTPSGPTIGSQPFLVLVRTPLEARRNYMVRFVFTSAGAAGNTTATADGRTAHTNYVSIDAGLAYAGTSFLVVGCSFVPPVKFEFVPILKSGECRPARCA